MPAPMLKTTWKATGRSAEPQARFNEAVARMLQRVNVVRGGPDDAYWTRDGLVLDLKQAVEDIAISGGYGPSSATPFLGEIRAWHPPAGWDGTTMPAAGWQIADGTGGTLDLRKRALVGRDPDGGTDYATVGQTFGYARHGQTENNHADHSLNHYHEVDTQEIHDGEGAAVTVVVPKMVLGVPSTDLVSDWWSCIRPPASSPYYPGMLEPISDSGGDTRTQLAQHHGGAETASGGLPGADTDNRPPSIIVIWLEYVGT